MVVTFDCVHELCVIHRGAADDDCPCGDVLFEGLETRDELKDDGW